MAMRQGQVRASTLLAELIRVEQLKTRFVDSALIQGTMQRFRRENLIKLLRSELKREMGALANERRSSEIARDKVRDELRKQRGAGLPAGWKAVPSSSRPGEFSYVHTFTGEKARATAAVNMSACVLACCVRTKAIVFDSMYIHGRACAVRRQLISGEAARLCATLCRRPSVGEGVYSGCP